MIQVEGSGMPAVGDAAARSRAAMVGVAALPTSRLAFGWMQGVLAHREIGSGVRSRPALQVLR
jgi:hypothetical protein